MVHLMIYGLSESLGNLLKGSLLMEEFGDLILGESWNSFINVATKIVEGTPLGCLVGLLGGVVATATSMNFEDYVKMYVSDPKFWAGIAGGILFDVGAIVTFTGIGLPLGLGLMVQVLYSLLIVVVYSILIKMVNMLELLMKI